ncbi:Cation/H(+) antiporter 18 [Arabidopsis thaliana]|uniref:Cation/H(+) antiporter 18 n=8 Tax=Arabidopsis TaxID=3701 RepID=CHX18_ARATH|nr:cation/H+ exchanger 18 [Arabidopsis thaliana]NP_198976.3 cation/H+ exchanger 18 [Arabidopsis thaliana]Q9FFR9.1 RecName: Full=Cation/H(+) antiporter 18; AltName: Full=Protein CATION/H+ EXCHANGER 18; Short=AtCHX18 [Arabidopsis thaliana]KAG7604540.1 Cation/H+ exchanger [Arabidopsis thaliana x Arabidopsis arenosa]KAG7611469.1 Cation/H+ exchanger [Arabidopsis suecica]AED94698.1 cation/H+ exchanger 18 [Arabidopsis thaliana]ANM70858.1 cation/H+ exchanger 18 [Arabidopsis thaliana]KAG7604541.1 Cat|eukprot:NP_001332436.1 cation/H+ exchanger 18 [Arabidopsis thaliana]
MATNSTKACPAPMKATSNGVFQGDNPIDFALPLAILQIVIVIVLTRVLAYLLRPLRQPRVIAEVIGGIMLGPSLLGRSKAFLDAVFPKKSLTVLETLANLGLLFFLFLAGLEIDTKALRRTGKKALGIALAGITLPFALGIGSSFVLKATISKGVNSTAFLVFMGVALSITAFPVLARILAELKLLTTEIGRLAMSAAAVNDVAAWILLALAIALSGSNTSPLVSLWVFLSGCAFVIGASFIIPPIFRWISRRCHEGEPIEETYICATLAVVLVCGFITDAIGIHSMFGAFVVGVLIPKEGPFAGALVEKVEDLVSGLFLPLYFVASGLKTNVATIQGAQSWGLLVLVTATACFGKILGTLGVSLAFKIPMREAITLGFLMNTKGLVELIVLNIGKDRKVLNDQTFAIMVLMALFTTFITTPVVMAVYKPARRAKKEGEYKHRAVERENTNTQLRILTCFHGAGSIPSMINLLEASRGIEKGEGLCVYALHLRELSERSSAILMVHKVRKNGMPFWNRRGVNADADQVVVAFQAFQQLSRVNVRPMTAISSMSDIHEDICTTAVRKKAAIVILPFHKHQQLDGSLETTRGDYRWVNRRVLLQAPCSVGIFVDRGLGGSSQVSAQDVSYSVVVLFFGGPDDREALAYGLRMAEHPGIVLTVFRFVVSPERVGEIVNVEVSNNNNENQSVKNLKSDEEIMSEIRKISSVDESVKFVEKQIENAAVDVRSAIEEVRRSNLFLVGRMPGGEIALAIRENSECPELGPVGSLLISPESSTKASVLVIQQYNGTGIAPDLGAAETEVLTSTDKDSD